MRQIALPDGRAVSAIGQGTWRMGENRRSPDEEARALRHGIDLGMTLIDTAEMYADGNAERVVGKAIHGQRNAVFVVSKVYPHNASATGVIEACERSLTRLGTDTIDLFLLHWRGGVPLRDTLAGFEALVSAGKIGAWGVSNFDTDDMAELAALNGGDGCATDQVLYNPEARGIEHDLLPACEAKKIPVMAYSPVGQGGKLLKNPALKAVAARHGKTTAQVALAWGLRHPHVIAIPMSSDIAHVEQNAASDFSLLPDDLAEIDRAFPPPRGKRALQML